VEWNQDKQVMCDHVSYHHVMQGLVMLRDYGKASDRSRQGHQSLTGKPSSGMRTASPRAGSKWVTHWTSENVYWALAEGLYNNTEMKRSVIAITLYQ
jgi:hypothetical protein